MTHESAAGAHLFAWKCAGNEQWKSVSENQRAEGWSSTTLQENDAKSQNREGKPSRDVENVSGHLLGKRNLNLKVWGNF